MEAIPAIDIRDGKCVQLYQGDYDRETVFSDSPVDMARMWVDAGAARLHVVDLDGAREGSPVNIDLVEKIARSVTVPVQLGGGVRTVKSARDALSRGVERVIFGTAAAESQDLVSEVIEELGPDAVVIGVDARDGYVAVRGWTESSETPAIELVAAMEDSGVRRLVYTDIARDGTLTEPNFEAAQSLVSSTNIGVLVAGGVSSVDHLVRLAQLGVEGAIIGTAIYTGDIDLGNAIDVLTAKKIV